MGQDRTLARGARVTGAAVLAVLALLSLGWIIRDFAEAKHVTDVWGLWTGLPARADGGWAGSYLEPALLVLYTVSAVTAARSSSAAGILASAGVLTLVLRLPSLWQLNAEWIRSVDETRDLAFTSVLVALALALVLLVVAGVGRRPVGGPPQPGAVPYGAPGYAPGAFPGQVPPGFAGAVPPPGGPLPGGAGPHGGAPLEAPGRPTAAGALAGGLALGVTAAVLAAWELHTWMTAGWDGYIPTLAEDHGAVSLLSVPPHWFNWAVVLISLVGALATVTKATYARPLGMSVAAMYLAGGVFGLSGALQGDLGALETSGWLALASLALQTTTGVLLLVVLSRQEAGDDGQFVPELVVEMDAPVPGAAPVPGPGPAGAAPASPAGPAPGFGPPPPGPGFGPPPAVPPMPPGPPAP
ncbi:hypothetical protein [Streptomyces sp. HNM0574]|uniref:hypothetical protein n=1 Tax=Streptomyces sp. HNM0574 TaxID=2714954 RepID=UPI00146D9273|nr:hypothetical protein [Streptomyces sp. HNM0574]NLU67323.1 hypothetical protein [Streptomyces sp. HNM0574]